MKPLSDFFFFFSLSSSSSSFENPEFPVPRFFGTASVWSPCLPTLTSEIPEVSIGTGVWIQFEGGDLQYPVYVSFFWEGF